MDNSQSHLLKQVTWHSYVCFMALTIPILLGWSSVKAYDSPLFHSIPNRNLQNKCQLGLYDLTTNPAFFSTTYPENLASYRFGVNHRESPFHRLFDPKRRQDYQLWIYNINHLSEKITLGASISYQRTDLFRLYRSLEKDFYSEYFALTDTTTGNTTFDGPQVAFLYNYALTSRLNLGLEINYGVEHGLKDVFTKCETIMRNIDLSGGLGWQTRNGKFAWGVFGRYFNNQRKYEAVKELQDALVKTYFGYHVFKSENPRSTNRKNDDRLGYEVGGQLAFQNIGLSGLQLLLASSLGAKSTEVSVGSVTSPEPKGYHLQEGQHFLTNLGYFPKGKSGCSLLYERNQLIDWVESGAYNVIIVEFRETAQHLRLRGIWEVSKILELTAGYDWAEYRDNYKEFIQIFTSLQTRLNRAYFVETRLQLNPILTGFYRLEIGSAEPFFYWNTARINSKALEFGIERLGTFGKIAIAVNLGQETASGYPHTNQLLGFSFKYWR